MENIDRGKSVVSILEEIPKKIKYLLYTLTLLTSVNTEGKEVPVVIPKIENNPTIYDDKFYELYMSIFFDTSGKPTETYLKMEELQDFKIEQYDGKDLPSFEIVKNMEMEIQILEKWLKEAKQKVEKINKEEYTREQHRLLRKATEWLLSLDDALKEIKKRLEQYKLQNN